MSHVAIIFINYNSTKLTKQAIASFWRTKEKKDTYSILVWDNASTEVPTNEQLGRCEIVVSKKNLGFAQGYNEAVRYALRKYKPDYILIVNNDTKAARGLIKELIVTSKHYKDKAIVAPKIYFDKGYEFYRHDYLPEERGNVIWYAGGNIDMANVIPFHKGVDEVDRGQYDIQEETSFVSGCCFLTTPKVWKTLKGFDRKYFMYYEDVDFCMRARKKRITIVYAPKAWIYHINAGSSQGSGSRFHQYYQTRNRLRFGLQYARLRSKLALLKEAKQIWMTGNSAQKQGVIHALEGKWGMRKINDK
jgi:GT2 family glycosyltransferase